MRAWYQTPPKILCAPECGDMPRQPIAFWISAQVAGITCMTPRAPTGETAAGSSPLSCTPWALAQRQSGPPFESMGASQRDAARWNSESNSRENESDQQGGADIALAVVISSSARIGED